MAFCGFNSWQVKQGLFPCFRSPKNMLFNTFFSYMNHYELV